MIPHWTVKKPKNKQFKECVAHNGLLYLKKEDI